MPSNVKGSRDGYLLLIIFSIMLYMTCKNIVLQSNNTNSFKIQKSMSKIYSKGNNAIFSKIEVNYGKTSNTTIISNSSTEEGQIKLKNSSDAVKAQHFGPRQEEPVRRVLWWSTVYGSTIAGFFGFGTDLLPLQEKCKVKCEFTLNKTLLESSHAVIFHGWGQDLPTEVVEINGKNLTVPAHAPPERYENQIYIYFTMEPAPRIRTDMEAYKHFFNWTITYRLDSDFIISYGYFNRKTEEEIQSYQPAFDGIVYAKLAKTNLVAWMASNCDDVPSKRNKLVKELQKYITVTTYGKCGDHQCNSNVTPDCFEEIAMSHKFYLSFENCLCKDYVTEKFIKPIEANMVPVVYGKANYGLQFAPGSFINVDSFPSAKALAHYLLYLNKNDEEYLKYFEWRRYYSVDNYWSLTEALCGACERLYERPQKPAILDINDWLFRNNSENPVCVEPRANF